MGITRIRFIQNQQSLWYWQYVDERLEVQAEGTKLHDNLEACVINAGLVTGLKIDLSYEEADFGVMKQLFVHREKPVGIEVRVGEPVR